MFGKWFSKCKDARSTRAVFCSVVAGAVHERAARRGAGAAGAAGGAVLLLCAVRAPAAAGAHHRPLPPGASAGRLRPPQ